MGPALEPSGKTFSFLGVKGGVGCSILCALLARLAARNKGEKIALIDANPFSLTPSYLSITHTSHYLSQLEPYQDHLTPKMVENYFSLSPEGVAYIPLRPGEGNPLTLSQSLGILDKMIPWFDRFYFDLSSFSADQYIPVLEKSAGVFFISSLEPSSLAAVKQWEKRLLPFHFQLDQFHLVFNQMAQSQVVPRDLEAWSGHFSHAGNVPFMGEDLSLHLFERGVLTPALEKNLATLAEKTSMGKSPFSAMPGPSPSQDASLPAGADGINLDQVHQLHQKLLESLRNSGAVKEQKNGDVLQRQVLEPNAREILDRLIQEMKISNRAVSQRLVTETLNLAFGLGPLEPLLQDSAVTEIMVNGPRQIYVEKKGLLEKTDVVFRDEQQLRTVIERILAPIGRRIDESQPYVDGRLADGSRVNAVIPPLSLVGPVLTIRKFSKKKLQVEDLIKFGSITQEAADFLGACVRARKNIVVSGGTGSGKTTLLNILSNFIPTSERIVTIEDSAELQLNQDHVVRLESRPANLEGKGQVAIRDLVINALRMRPDRIVVGECRGGEALDMLQAMNTGHDGSLTTAHANSPRDVLSRLETMCLFTGLELPIKAIREQISRAVHLVVQQSRLEGGKRSVTHVSALQGMEGDVIVTQEIFVYEEGKGLVRRPFAPAFIKDLNAAGYKWPGHGEK